MTTKKYFFLIVPIIATIIGCSEKHSTATQVIAKINDTEITVSELNNELNTANTLQTFNPKSKKELLNQLIQRELLASEAVKQNLNRTPASVQHVESAKKKIYAEIYTDAILGKSVSTPNQEVIHNFVNTHSFIFKPHKFVSTETLTINQTLSIAETETLNGMSDNYLAIKSFVESSRISHSIRHRTFGAEELQPEFFKQNTPPQVGTTLFHQDSKKIRFTGITAIADEPINDEEASNIALRLLLDEKRNQAVAYETNRLKLIANIQILNDNFMQ